MKKFFIIYILFISSISFLQAQSLNGTTWSYKENIQELSSNKIIDVKIYFTFVSDIDVLWYYATPEGTFFPVGFGRCNTTLNTITFSHKNHLHKNISLYSEARDYNFKYEYSNGSLLIQYIGDSINLTPYSIFESSLNVSFKKEQKSLLPNSNLVRTSWLYSYKEQIGTINFATKYVAYIDGEKVPYVCVGDIVAIKSGDNIYDESLVGMLNSKQMTLCRTGIEGLTDICTIMNKQ